jgi:hypothetical protein
VGAGQSFKAIERCAKRVNRKKLGSAAMDELEKWLSIVLAVNKWWKAAWGAIFIIRKHHTTENIAKYMDF